MLAIALLFVSCSGEGPAGGLVIEGQIANAPNLSVHLDRTTLSNTSQILALDKTETDASGHFRFELQTHPGKG
ncbi:MAG: hypothetical protein D6818_03205, partial [Bacteroidetes bacterium]